MGCFNFKILENRKYFCKLFVGGTIINLVLGGMNLLMEVFFKCYNIINEQYHYMQIIIIVNYLIMILILVVFAENKLKKNRQNREIEFNNNQNNQNNENTNIFLIPAYLPKYSEIKNDKPPSYQENYVITISPTAPLLQNRE
jgi:septal ring-binding cell division protein DamX